MSKRKATKRGSVFGWPILLGLASGAALVVGLLGHGLFDLLCWIGLGLPVAAILWSWQSRGRA